MSKVSNRLPKYVKYSAETFLFKSLTPSNTRMFLHSKKILTALKPKGNTEGTTRTTQASANAALTTSATTPPRRPALNTNFYGVVIEVSQSLRPRFYVNGTAEFASIVPLISSYTGLVVTLSLPQMEKKPQACNEKESVNEFSLRTAKRKESSAKGENFLKS
ncbi:hypothetical protein WN51_01110 [Melipona quadrifasciata]|uniref:Uncharacterized protein n=1 Tax=Melipona quadrifasciata TaxID=166423 RepID=A0A0N0BEX3_9HYME|nr:hypothetical protein WN51_01110 [Melipona quadrifasciata]